MPAIRNTRRTNTRQPEYKGCDPSPRQLAAILRGEATPPSSSDVESDSESDMSMDDEDDEDDDAGSIDGFEVGVETQNLIDSAQAQPIVVEDEEDEVVVEHEDEGWNRDVEVMEWPHDDDPSQPVTRPDAVDEPSVAQDSLLSSAPAPATTKRQRYPTWAVAPTWSEGNEDEIGEHAHQLVNDDDEVEGEDGMMEGDRSSGQELDEATRVVTGDLGAVPGLAEALERLKRSEIAVEVFEEEGEDTTAAKQLWLTALCESTLLMRVAGMR